MEGVPDAASLSVVSVAAPSYHWLGYDGHTGGVGCLHLDRFVRHRTGCVIPCPGFLWSREGGFTQHRAHLFDDLCTVPLVAFPQVPDDCRQLLRPPDRHSLHRGWRREQEGQCHRLRLSPTGGRPATAVRRTFLKRHHHGCTVSSLGFELYFQSTQKICKCSGLVLLSVEALGDKTPQCGCNHGSNVRAAMLCIYLYTKYIT